MELMSKDEIREALKTGGDWLCAARNWLQWHKDPHGRLIWGSGDEVRMTVKEIEDLALEVAVAALAESQKLDAPKG
jgi:hypothetical protein